MTASGKVSARDTADLSEWGFHLGTVLGTD